MTSDYLSSSFISKTLIKNTELLLIDYLFPYKYKNSQKELIIDLINNPKALLYAQTGYGKSVCSLTAVIMNLLNPATNIKKIIVLVRMKTQIFRILEECSSINTMYKKNKPNIETLLQTSLSFDDILAVPLIAREDLCINAVHPNDIMDCKALNCQYYITPLPSQNILGDLIPLYVSEPKRNTNDIINFFNAQTPNNCPYYMIKSLLTNNKLKIIVTTHAWFINSGLREILFNNITLDATALIVDEVHNFRPQTTYTISYMKLLEAKNLSDKYDLPCKYYIYELEYAFRISYLNETQPLINNETAIIFEYVQHSIRKLKLMNLTTDDRVGLKALQSLYDILTADGDMWYYDREDNTKVLKRVIPYPESIFNVLQSFPKIILMSGTIYPPEAYIKFFGLSNAFKIIQTPQYQKNIFYATYTGTDLSSRLESRSPRLFVSQAKTVQKLHTINPIHTLVFTPSHEYTLALGECYKKVFHGKTVYCEGSSNENQIILDELRTKDHELIFATFGGSFSEGIEIKDKITDQSKISLIIFCGIPIPPPTIQQKILQTKYLQRYSTKVVYLFLYRLPIYQALLQAAGRGIRSPSDFTAIICLDNRLLDLQIFSDEHMTKAKDINKIEEKLKIFYLMNTTNYCDHPNIEHS